MFAFSTRAASRALPSLTRRGWLVALSSVACVAMASGASVLSAQGAPAPTPQQPGPVIQSAGAAYLVENPTFAVPEGTEFKALFQVNVGGGDSLKVNDQVNTMARFYNLHAKNGFPENRLHGAAVFHGTGWTALLTDSAFVARFGGKGNPSKRLVQELLQHGAQLVLCGQTAGARGIRREELLPGVKVAVSAMTAVIVLQSQGYEYIPW